MRIFTPLSIYAELSPASWATSIKSFQTISHQVNVSFLAGRKLMFTLITMGILALTRLSAYAQSDISYNHYYMSPGTGEWISNTHLSDANKWGIDFFTGNQLRLRINSDGNMGIGTTTPISMLDVCASDKISSIRISQSGVKDFTGLRMDRGTSEKWFLGMNNIDDNLKFRAYGSTDLITITPNGLIGVGTAAPSSVLDINRAGTEATLRINQSGIKKFTGLRMARSSSEKWFLGMNTLDDDLKIRSNDSTDLITITSKGLIGIGTTVPSSVLDIKGSNIVTTIRIDQSGTRSYSGLRLDRNSSEKWFLGMDNLGDNLKLRVNGLTDLITVTSAGGIGIGTATPGEKLEVNGNIRASTIYADNLQLTDTINVFFGALAGSQGLHNSNFGTQAGSHIDRRAGFNNSTFGYQAGYTLTFSSDNTAMGYHAGKSLEGLGNVMVGSRSAENIPGANYSVFLGYNAGSDFSHVTFEGGQNPLTNGKSVFVVNNQAQLHNPLLFGVFADNTDKDDPDHRTVNGSMAQLAINTHHLVDSCALTVAGAVHIGPKDLDPSKFPNDSLYANYLLWAERGVVSENFAIVKVEDWGDYVFGDDYNLTPLPEVEKYIEANKHLPNVPSEAELKERGYTVHDMNKKFIEKIEELTLYSIEQDKKIADLVKQVETLKDMVESMAKK